METGIVLLVAVLVIFVVVSIGMFFFTFVRRKGARLDDLTVKENSSLRKYHALIQEGMDFIDRYPRKIVTTKSYDGLKLSASEFCCKHARGTMILFHGYRSMAKRDFSCAVRMYLQHGLNVVMVDQRSHGASEGRLITFGVKERKDVLSWINYVRERFGEDEPIFLGGMSMGATTVMMATELDLPENVKGQVVDCGYTSAADIIGLVSVRKYHVPASITLTMMEWVCRLFGGFSLYESSSVTALAKKDNIPVFFIHGKADRLVPYEMSIQSYEAAASRKYILLVEGAAHGCSYLVDPEGVDSRIGDFIDRCFAVR